MEIVYRLGQATAAALLEMDAGRLTPEPLDRMWKMIEQAGKEGR